VIAKPVATNGASLDIDWLRFCAVGLPCDITFEVQAIFEDVSHVPVAGPSAAQPTPTRRHPSGST
jgi:hypothetical protein